MIRAENIWKSFGEKLILRGLTLEVEKGETVVILGRSGVGKSVLLRLIIGLIFLDEGFVEVDGVRISDLKGPKLYQAIRRMGMLFQGSALFDSMTVGDNVAFYLRQHGDPETGRRMQESKIQSCISEALEMVGLAGTENLFPSALSGGMRKRVALARLIVYRPQILLYDEPTTGLDPVTAMQINQLIVKIQQELQATSLVVTHDLRSAMEVGDRLALHHEGQIAFIGDKESFVKNDHPLIQSFIENAGLQEGGRL